MMEKDSIFLCVILLSIYSEYNMQLLQVALRVAWCKTAPSNGCQCCMCLHM